MAKCDDWTKVHRHWKPGDVVWASAFKETSGKSGALLKQLPQRGILAAERTEARHENRLARTPGAEARYFVPLTKSGRPSWSKAVWLGSREYADTEAESVELYDAAVRRAIEEHRARIRALTAELVSAEVKNDDAEEEIIT